MDALVDNRRWAEKIRSEILRIGCVTPTGLALSFDAEPSHMATECRKLSDNPASGIGRRRRRGSNGYEYYALDPIVELKVDTVPAPVQVQESTFAADHAVAQPQAELGAAMPEEPAAAKSFRLSEVPTLTQPIFYLSSDGRLVIECDEFTAAVDDRDLPRLRKLIA